MTDVSHFNDPRLSDTYLFATQNRVYGIGWGHRDLEFRRTLVTVHAMNDDEICFQIDGLRSYKEGYYVRIDKKDAESRATCLTDWCQLHPEDAQPGR